MVTNPELTVLTPEEVEAKKKSQFLWKLRQEAQDRERALATESYEKERAGAIAQREREKTGVQGPETLEDKLKRLKTERALKGLEEWEEKERPSIGKAIRGTEGFLGGQIRGRIRRTPQEMKRPPFVAPEAPMSQIEQYWEEEAQDFEPFGEQRDIEADAAGIGVLSDPFEAPGASSMSIFSPGEDFLSNFLGTDVFSPQQVPPTVVQEVKISVPGGLTVTHILQNAKGEIGYRVAWQGTVLDWWPPVEEEARIVEAGI